MNTDSLTTNLYEYAGMGCENGDGVLFLRVRKGLRPRFVVKVLPMLPDQFSGGEIGVAERYRCDMFGHGFADAPQECCERANHSTRR